MFRALRIRLFWRWFAKNADSYLHYKAKDELALFERLSAQLTKIDKNLAFEFGPLASGKKEFTVSCGGIRSSMHSVEAVVQAAPPLRKWQVLAFRQRHYTEQIGLNGVVLDIKDLRFTYRFNENNQIDVDLYIRGYTDKQVHIYGSIAFLFLDHLLGERDVMTKLGVLEFKPLPKRPTKHLRPLKELVKLADSRRPNLYGEKIRI